MCVSPEAVDLEKDWEDINSVIRVEEILICDDIDCPVVNLEVNIKLICLV